MSLDKPSDKGSLAWAFWNAVMNRRDERLDEGRRWDRDGDDWSQFAKTARERAAIIFEGCREPFGKKLECAKEQLGAAVSEGAGSGPQLRQMLTGAELSDLIGGELVEMAKVADSRLALLITILENTDACSASVPFLARVARCFLFGFDPECVIMCRSVLDSALKEKTSGTSKISAGLRLQKLKDNGLIDEGTANVASAVLECGNMTVHDAPAMPQLYGECIGVDLIVKCTTTVLARLYN